MKAILINRGGFRKRLMVMESERPRGFRIQENEEISFLPYEDVKDRYIPIREFEFDREYVDEWGEKVLIYKEY